MWRADLVQKVQQEWAESQAAIRQLEADCPPEMHFCAEAYRFGTSAQAYVKILPYWKCHLGVMAGAGAYPDTIQKQARADACVTGKILDEIREMNPGQVADRFSVHEEMRRRRKLPDPCKPSK